MNSVGQLLDVTLFVVAPVLATLVLLALVHVGARERITRVTWGAARWWIFVVSRVGYAVALYEILGYEGSFDLQFFAARVELMNDGAVAGSDFVNGYGPLFYYVRQLSVAVVPESRMLGMLAPVVVGDALCVLLAPRIAGRLVGPSVVPLVGTWALLTPFLWHQAVLRGQDEPVFMAFLLVGLWLVVRERPVGAGLVAGIGLAVTKLSFLPFLLPLTIGAAATWRGRARASVACLASATLGYGYYLGRGGDARGLLRFAEASFYGWNPVSVVARAFGEAGYAWAVRGYVVVSVGLTLLVLWATRSRRSGACAEAGLVAAQTGSMLSIPKLHGAYVGQAALVILLPIVRHLDTRGGRAAYITLTLLALLSTSGFGDIGPGAWVQGALITGLHTGVLLLALRQPRTAS